MMTAYFDASGKLSDPKIDWLLLAGLVSTVNKWEKFERDWAKALKDEGVTEFHMTRFMFNHGEFEGWRGDYARQTAFLLRLGKIIKKWTLFSVSRGADLKAYRAIDERYQYHEHAAYPYAQCGLTAISGVRRTLRMLNRRDPVLYVFEKGDDDQDQLLDRCRTDLKPPLDGDPLFLPKRYEDDGGNVVYRLPFQACDFMAWEHHKAFKTWANDPDTDLRIPLKWMYDNLKGDWKYQKHDSYEQIVARLRIPVRKKEV